MQKENVRIKCWWIQRDHQKSIPSSKVENYVFDLDPPLSFQPERLKGKDIIPVEQIYFRL